jgi:hypothetical protein
MSVREFEQEYRQAVDTILNRLQSITLLSHKIDVETAEIAESVYDLTQMVEEFLATQPSSGEEDAPSP